MNMVIQITLCVLLILGFAWLLWMLGCALLTPVRSGRDTRITLVVQARGDAPELENLLRGALWLRESGTAAADILLVDCGLTEEAAALAERLARQCEDLKLCNTEEICQWMQHQSNRIMRHRRGGHLSERGKRLHRAQA